MNTVISMIRGIRNEGLYGDSDARHKANINIDAFVMPKNRQSIVVATIVETSMRFLEGSVFVQ